jgi:hypothetical protein
MSLRPCSEYHENVSTHAASCPHCGYPMSSNQTLNYFEKLAGWGRRISFLLLMVGLVISMNGVMQGDSFVLGIVLAIAGLVGCTLSQVQLGLIERSRDK